MDGEMKKEISFVEGSIFKALFRFALPVLGALVLQAAYGAVDLLVVGWFGDATSLSAVGTGSTFMHMVTVVITSLAMGGTVVIGQYIGEKRPEDAGNMVGTTIVMFTLLGLILTVVMEVFAGDIVRLMQIPPESFEKAVDYVQICSGGILVIIAYNLISSILRGAGNAKLPFIFVGIACVVNIVGDLILVGVFHMDATGAALATVFAQLVSVVISFPMLRKTKIPIQFSRRQCRIYGSELKKVLKIGAPIALQDATVQISFLVINTIINHMGLLPAAGYGVAQKIVAFILLVPCSLTQSVSAFVAHNVGAGQLDRARKGVRIAMMGGCAVGIAIFFVGFFGGDIISSIFTSDVAVITQSAAYLKGYSIECILTCILFSSIGYFNGRGNSIPVMLQGITSACLVRIPVSILMAGLPNTSLFLMGLATPITTVYGIFFFLVCFAWERKKEKVKVC